jgi:uncharacterized protein (TIGR04442 family)
VLQAIVHHGFISEAIEYFATVSGPDLDRKFFFEQTLNGAGRSVRYFSGGSEITLQPAGVSFRGNGGMFGEYMFGGHFPVQDLLNDEVVNRLVVFGGVYDPLAHELRFTSHTSGSETYGEIFLQGNAVANYFFFVDDRGLARSVVERQERSLRMIGKLLKRSQKVGSGRFLDLAAEMHHGLGEPDSTVFLIRLVQREHQRFYDACRAAYGEHRSIADLTRHVDAQIPDLRIEPYQRERIQIDVIYHHRDNQQLINEYKRVLASCSDSKIGPSERARLMRLRTLSLRNEVPLSIFDTLEEIVLEGGVGHGASEEPPYIQSTREILEGLFLGGSINKRLDPADMIALLQNKQRAVANREQGFEEILLETGRLIDERASEEDALERMESFGELITLFDRFDHTMTLISRLAFMDDVELTEEQVRSILGNMHVFESLQRGLFRSLFIDPIVSNEYTLAYGRRKLFALTIGLLSIDNNEATLADVAGEIRKINSQEKAYYQLYQLARKRMATFYLELNTSEGRATFRKEIVTESDRVPELAEVLEHIDDELIDEVITKIRLEAFYINQLLPRIIDDYDARLRNDFLMNSGLDRFQVEELESEYFEMREFPPQLLQAIRQG